MAAGSSKKRFQHAFALAVTLTGFALFELRVHADPPPSADTPRASSQTFTYEDLQRLLDSNPGVTSPDDLLPLLPADCRSHFNLMHHSRSIQGSDWDDPRIILSCNGGRLLMSFAGSIAQARGDRIEIIRFDSNKNTFATSEIGFSRKPPVQENPVECISCHGSTSKPIWDSYDLWPGAYGSSSGIMFKGAEETNHFKEFLKKHQGKQDRYSKMIGLFENRDHEGNPDQLSITTALGQLEPNARLGIELSTLNNERISSQLLAIPSFAQERYAFLAALLGCGPITDYFQEPKKSALTTLQTPDAKEIKKRIRAYFYDRLKREGNSAQVPNAKKPQPPIDPNSDVYVPNSETDGRGRVSLEAYGASKLLPLSQLMATHNIDIRDWYLPRESGSYDSADGAGGLEFGLAVKAVKDLSQSDKKLRALIPIHTVTDDYSYDEIDLEKVYNAKPIQSFSEESRNVNSTGSTLIETFQKGPICQYLKTKSLAAQRPTTLGSASRDCVDCSTQAHSQAQNETAPAVNPAVVTGTQATRILRGQQLIQQRCTDCHSELPKLLSPGTPKLFNEVLRRVGSDDPDVQMPRGDALSPEEKSFVEAYIRSLLAK